MNQHRSGKHPQSPFQKTSYEITRYFFVLYHEGSFQLGRFLRNFLSFFFSGNFVAPIRCKMLRLLPGAGPFVLSLCFEIFRACSVLGRNVHRSRACIVIIAKLGWIALPRNNFYKRMVCLVPRVPRPFAQKWFPNWRNVPGEIFASSRPRNTAARSYVYKSARTSSYHRTMYRALLKDEHGAVVASVKRANRVEVYDLKF